MSYTIKVRITRDGEVIYEGPAECGEESGVLELPGIYTVLKDDLIEHLDYTKVRDPSGLQVIETLMPSISRYALATAEAHAEWFQEDGLSISGFALYSSSKTS